MKLGIEKDLICINSIKTIWLPEFSKILDVSIDDTSLIFIFEYDNDYLSLPDGFFHNNKMYNYWLTEEQNLIHPNFPQCLFFGKIEKKIIEVDLSKTNEGKIYPFEQIVRYYLFIEEVKQ